MHNTVIIICDGQFPKTEYPRYLIGSADFIICCDGALKKFMKNVYEICCSDQSQIMRFMNDHFNMDPEKCSVDFDIRAYTIYWTISMYHNKERYYYISQLGRPIDMDNFYDWAMKMMT